MTGREKPYYYDWDENGVRVRIDRKTGKKTPVDEAVRRAAEEGRLVTMEQAMANEHKKKQEKENADIDEIEET